MVRDGTGIVNSLSISSCHPTPHPPHSTMIYTVLCHSLALSPISFSSHLCHSEAQPRNLDASHQEPKSGQNQGRPLSAAPSCANLLTPPPPGTPLPPLLAGSVKVHLETYPKLIIAAAAQILAVVNYSGCMGSAGEPVDPCVAGQTRPDRATDCSRLGVSFPLPGRYFQPSLIFCIGIDRRRSPRRGTNPLVVRTG